MFEKICKLKKNDKNEKENQVLTIKSTINLLKVS